MGKKIIIIGGIGTAVNIAEQIQDAVDNYNYEDEFIGFAFDDESFGKEINGFPVLSKTREVYEKYEKYDDVFFIYQLYRPDKLMERASWLPQFKIPLERYGNFIHPSVTVCRSFKMGYGNVIQAGSVISSNTIMGNHNTFNSMCLFGHDTVMGNHNFFAAHSLIGSNIKMGSYIFMGLNSSLNNKIEVGDNIMVAMGSNVIKSIQDNQVVMGNPAKFAKNL
ncbi:hypothetical protein [uncultured Tenacibaculum sp.]|uniref:hypothetical protein n=1 Tax=uncultured Tenacibaculum sp. TaxID=174713 RepID=UPI002638E69A|nr:hypothetical protein [uncultured Tenacibaculum sp.]